jgi:NAD(P)H-hydrate epimerase
VAKKIGCRQHLVTPDSLQTKLPHRSASAHKGNNGHVLILAGSPGKTGAAAMAATAAMRGGAGLVTLGIPDSLNPVLETMVTETMTVGLAETVEQTIDEKAFDAIGSLLDGKQCLAIGPGLGTHPSTGRLLTRLIEESTLPIVMDADALNLISSDASVLKKSKAPMILTPHPGEMSRLTGHTTGKIQADRSESARSFALSNEVHLLLKGAATVIATPEGTVFINPTGNPGMAAGGMGDVLTGLIAGLISQGMEPGEAARTSVFLHGSAADKIAARWAPVGYLATEVMNEIPTAMKNLRRGVETANGLQIDPLFRSPGEES